MTLPIELPPQVEEAQYAFVAKFFNLTLRACWASMYGTPY